MMWTPSAVHLVEVHTQSLHVEGLSPSSTQSPRASEPFVESAPAERLVGAVRNLKLFPPIGCELVGQETWRLLGHAP